MDGPLYNVEYIRYFTEHCERTLDRLERDRLTRALWHKNSRKLINAMLQWLGYRQAEVQYNTIPKVYSERLASVLQRVLDYESYRVDGKTFGFNESHKRWAKWQLAYLTEPVPGHVVEEQFQHVYQPANNNRVFYDNPRGWRSSKWGDYGPLLGLAFTTDLHGNNRHPVINPRYAHMQRNPKNFGHNGLTVGDCFANRTMATFAGAHDESMKGIAGNREDGAWSVVSSGAYDEVETDLGDVIYYAGSGSQDNKDPDNVQRTIGTDALLKSLETGRPVRLLRSGTGSDRGQYCPRKGIRYDGLYDVEEVEYKKNKHGGLWAEFKLVRQSGQLPMGALMLRPNEEELEIIDAAKKGY